MLAMCIVTRTTYCVWADSKRLCVGLKWDATQPDGLAHVCVLSELTKHLSGLTKMWWDPGQGHNPLTTSHSLTCSWHRDGNAFRGWSQLSCGDQIHMNARQRCIEEVVFFFFFPCLVRIAFF